MVYKFLLSLVLLSVASPAFASVASSSVCPGGDDDPKGVFCPGGDDDPKGVFCPGGDDDPKS